MSEPAPAPEPKVPVWKNPYVIGFLLGALFLTVLPFMQRRFLKAPPPVAQLNAWSLTPLGGGPVSSEALRGQVVLLTVELAPCEAECQQRQRDFGTATRHVDDLGGTVTLVTVVGDEAKPGLAELIAAATPAWRFAGGPPTQLEPLLGQLQAGLDAFRGAPGGPQFARAGAIVLIDQNNAVRGYWMGDGAGRGNSINAARLLAKHGPNP